LLFEQAGRVPRREFRVGEVGDLLAQAGLHRVGVEREVDEDAAHALALEFEGAALFGGETGFRQG
jgi:hypothetical protein